MELTVNGYRGIDRADIVIPEGQITLLAAKNARGKSSIIEALVCNIQGNAFPLALAKKDISHVIHHGAKTTEISLEGKNGKRSILLPACEVKTSHGVGLNASPIALGVMKLGDMTVDQLSNTLSKELNVSLDRARLELEFSEIKIGEDKTLRVDLVKILADTVFGTDKIQAKGWEAGEKAAKEHATIMKTQFKSQTTFTWGANQGYTFTPKGWEPDLETAEIETLRADVVAAREALERAIAQNAVTEAEHETLKESAAKLEEWNQIFQQQMLDVAALEEKIAKIPKRVHVATCTGCKMTGHVIDGELVPIEAEVENETELGGGEAELKTKLSLAQKALASAENGIRAATAAEAKLKTVKVQESSPIQPARDAVERANLRLEAKSTKEKGVETHVQILAVLKAADILGPEGLRKRVLVSQLQHFNTSLSSLCNMAGWSQVAIQKDLTVTYDNKPYVTLSKSEKYRVNATLQLQLAVREKTEAPIVVFDEADMLDRDGRNQLFRLLVTLKVTAVVAMTIIVAKDGTRDVADLRKLGYGITYWVEDAKVSELNAEPQAVA